MSAAFPDVHAAAPRWLNVLAVMWSKVPETTVHLGAIKVQATTVGEALPASAIRRVERECERWERKCAA